MDTILLITGIISLILGFWGWLWLSDPGDMFANGSGYPKRNRYWHLYEKFEFTISLVLLFLAVVTITGFIFWGIFNEF